MRASHFLAISLASCLMSVHAMPTRVNHQESITSHDAGSQQMDAPKSRELPSIAELDDQFANDAENSKASQDFSSDVDQEYNQDDDSESLYGEEPIMRYEDGSQDPLLESNGNQAYIRDDESQSLGGEEMPTRNDGNQALQDFDSDDQYDDESESLDGEEPITHGADSQDPENQQLNPEEIDNALAAAGFPSTAELNALIAQAEVERNAARNTSSSSFDPAEYAQLIQDAENADIAIHEFMNAAEEAPSAEAMQELLDRLGESVSTEAAERGVYVTPRGDVAMLLIDRFGLQSSPKLFQVNSSVKFTQAVHNACSRVSDPESVEQASKIRALVPLMDTSTLKFQQLMIDFILKKRLGAVQVLLDANARLNQEAFATVMDAIASKAAYNTITRLLIQTHPEFVI